MPTTYQMKQEPFNVQMFDVTCNQTDDLIEVQINEDEKIIWVNVNGQCAFRACRIPTLIVHKGKKTFK